METGVCLLQIVLWWWLLLLVALACVLCVCAAVALGRLERGTAVGLVGARRRPVVAAVGGSAEIRRRTEEPLVLSRVGRLDAPTKHKARRSRATVRKNRREGQ